MKINSDGFQFSSRLIVVCFDSLYTRFSLLSFLQHGTINKMKKNLLLPILLSSLSLMACHKKSEETAPVEAAPKVAEAPAANTPEMKTATEMTDTEKEAAEKQKLMDYATMEDAYMNDAKSQWASSAKASSTFGDEDGNTPSSSSIADNLKGKVDGTTWTNNNQDLGFDWIELGYDKPVAATEVRLVMSNGNAPESISKVELQDNDGKWNTVWSGISDVKNDERGKRTWFVKTFPKTNYQVKAVKYTIANNVSHGYKYIDAAQLVGE